MKFDRFIHKYIYFSAILIIFTSCNEGLAPPESNDKTTITGIIRYIGSETDWPPADSIKDLRVVAFKNYPPKDIFSEVTSGNAYFTMQKLPYHVSSSTFSLDIPDAPIDIKYLVAAQQYGSILEWRAIGVYTLSGDKTSPTPINVKKGKTYIADIIVDFKDLPPQPF